MNELGLFEWVTLRGRRINFGLIGGRVVLVFGGAKPFGSVTVDRLDAVVRDAEGVTADGTTLNVGALGIVGIVGYLSKINTFAQSPRRLFDRMLDLFSGSAYFPESFAATIRAVTGHAGVGGDTEYYIDAAKRQLQPWSTDSVDVEVQTIA